MATAAIPDTLGQWRSAGDGWFVGFADGVSASIQSTRKGGTVRFDLKISGRSGSVRSAQARIEAMVEVLGVGGGPADRDAAPVAPVEA
jgi:hypothetical protein